MVLQKMFGSLTAADMKVQLKSLWKITVIIFGLCNDKQELKRAK